jgi:hypothetical protein
MKCSARAQAALQHLACHREKAGLHSRRLGSVGDPVEFCGYGKDPGIRHYHLPFASRLRIFLWRFMPLSNAAIVKRS